MNKLKDKNNVLRPNFDKNIINTEKTRQQVTDLIKNELERMAHEWERKWYEEWLKNEK